MTAAQADLVRSELDLPEDLTLDTPRVEDGAAIWRLARDSKALDLPSSYSYLLWCRDFAATSPVARDADGGPVGFITGYVRPARPETLPVWQVAVDHAQRGRGLPATLLDGLLPPVAATGVRGIETTITPDPTASNRLFTSFAERHPAPLEREVLFHGGLFPDGAHEPDLLYRIGPLGSLGPSADRT
uniref:L-2,4-diaminobutyric acid acetyltransferase n=1 Tax=Streptomyces sp. WS088 TaxID=1814058 RepID=A0A159YK87_9ACTN|nr:L-2,4-diaminobutyric acid acetyltransferase subunit [Streptomyces sp. WS088]